MTRKYEIPLSFANFRFKKIFVRGKKLLFFHFDCVFAGIHLWAGRDQRCFALIKHTAFFGVGFVNRILFLLFWLIYFKHLNYSKWIPVLKKKVIRMNTIWFIIIGVLAGLIAGKIMRGGGFGFFINLLLGIIGGVIGGWAFSLFGLEASGLVGSLITATVGAILVLWIASLFSHPK